jgi:hypothetical protein
MRINLRMASQRVQLCALARLSWLAISAFGNRMLIMGSRPVAGLTSVVDALRCAAEVRRGMAEYPPLWPISLGAAGLL